MLALLVQKFKLRLVVNIFGVSIDALSIRLEMEELESELASLK